MTEDDIAALDQKEAEAAANISFKEILDKFRKQQ